MHQPCARHAGVNEPIGVQLHRGLGVNIGADVCAGFTGSRHDGCRLPLAPNAPRGCPFASGPALARAPGSPPGLWLTVPCACRSWVAVPCHALSRRCRQHSQSLHDHIVWQQDHLCCAQGAVSLAPWPHSLQAATRKQSLKVPPECPYPCLQPEPLPVGPAHSTPAGKSRTTPCRCPVPAPPGM